MRFTLLDYRAFGINPFLERGPPPELRCSTTQWRGKTNILEALHLLPWAAATGHP